MTTRTERPSPILLAVLAIVLVFAAFHFGRQLLAGESPLVAEPVDVVGTAPAGPVADPPPEWITPDQPRNPFAPTLGATNRRTVDASGPPELP
ncbi:MAG: hypothetical protein ACE367_27335 [Acidimicrobiales bacterium]